ncbi:MAG: DUF2892 domain-containing protein [Aquificota bacterium]|nr:DUF2892 domain-containing protein [Aquificota bacterium]
MERNMALWDRVIRVILGIIFIVLAVQNGGAWWILGILGIIFIITSVVGFCPVYKIVGLKTLREA